MIQHHVYILASKRNGTLYVGLTSDLRGRVRAHKQKLVQGFTKKYGVDRLVWYETHDSKDEALLREKRIKKWHRAWKLELIEARNPFWEDLYESLIQ